MNRALRVRLLAVLIGLLSEMMAMAQSPYIVTVQHYSLEQGLPNRIVLNIGQDKQGFIWVGTLDNAYRFDGNRFTALNLPIQNHRNQLPMTMLGLRNDAEGNLWFFGSQLSSRTQFTLLPSLGVPSEETQPVLFQTKFKRTYPFMKSSFCWPGQVVQATDPLLIYTNNAEVWRYQGGGRFRQLYKPTHQETRGYLLSLANGHCLLSHQKSTNGASSLKLDELDTAGQLVRQRTLPFSLAPVWGGAASDTSGTVYLYRPNDSAIRLNAHSIDNLLYRLSGNGQLTHVPITFTNNPIPNPAHPDWNEMQVQYDAHHGLFWVLGHNVLFAWHPQKGVVFNLAEAGFPVSSLQKISSLFVDRTGVVWAGSQNGLLQLTLESNRFSAYMAVTNKHTTAPTFSTRGIIQFGHEIWVNTNKTYRVDLNTGQTRLLWPSAPVQPMYYEAIKGQDGSFWAAFRGLVRVNPTTLVTKEYPLGRGNNACWAMWQDGRQNFWLGYDQGLSVFDWKLKKNTPFTRYNRYPELAENRVNGFFPDKRTGGVWVAASSGLYLLDTLRGIMTRYSSEEAAPRHLPFNHITFVHPDPHTPDLYWLATRGGGLIRWERNTGQYRQFTQQDGLLNNALYCIYEDKHGRLWLPSDYGLVWFQKQAIGQKTGAIQVFLPKDGIAHEEFNLTSHYRAPDGRLFLGGLNGVTAFYPDRVLDNAPRKAPLMLTRYQKLDPKTGDLVDQSADFRQVKQVELQPEDRSFVVSFALLDYRFNQQLRLWYRMANWQDSWTMQTQPDLRINGLPPGQYQLEVRAQNANGQWVSDTLTIPVQVHAPFYQVWWFWVVCALALFGLTVLALRWRTRQLEQDKAQLEAEVAQRTADLRASATLRARFFANVSHEFRTPLTLLLGPLEYLSKHTQDKGVLQLLQTMNRNARQLLAMVSDLLDLSKADAGQLSLQEKPADLRQLLRQTVAAFETNAQVAGIRLTVNTPAEPLWLPVDAPKVETVLKNLLANALRFTPAGKTVTVGLTDQVDAVAVDVSDTGSGIHPDDLPFIFERYYQSQQPDAQLQGGTGIGLALCREYCSRWEGALTVESQWGQGSRFTFTYPKHPVLPMDADQQADIASEPLFALPESASTLKWANLPVGTQSSVTKTLLLVEDNPDMLAYLQTLLAPHYGLQLARNGQQAWSWLNELSVSALPSLILSDMMMPEMDGMTLLAALRQHPDIRDIPVMMLSAQADLSVRLQALRLGIADYLTKPFAEDELLTRINNLLERTTERNAWRLQRPVAATPDPDTQNPESWLLAVQEFMLRNLTNPVLQITDIAEAVNSSERQLYRRIKESTGFSPNQFMQEIRLQTAREWLEKRHYTTVKEVAFGVGFQKTSYFSRIYLERFGISPGEVLRRAVQQPVGSAN